MLFMGYGILVNLLFAQVPKIGSDTTLDIAQWNIEWFGDSLNGPNNEAVQLKNASNVLLEMQMDIYSLCEISNPGYWQMLQKKLPEYGAVITSYSQSQKTALLYRKSMFRLLYSKSILLAFDYEFAGGRFPLEVALESQWGKKKDTLYFWVIHLKANTGSNSEKISAYNRRQKAAEELKNYTDSKKGLKGFIMGDWNDDLDVSIVSGKESPFLVWRNDSDYLFPSYRLSLEKQKSTAAYSEMIDHICVSKAIKQNYLPKQSGIMVGDSYIASYRYNTSDHYPVWAKFSMDLSLSANVTSVDPQAFSFVADDYLFWSGKQWEWKLHKPFLHNTMLMDGISQVFSADGKRLFRGNILEYIPQSPGVYYFVIQLSTGKMYHQKMMWVE